MQYLSIHPVDSTVHATRGALRRIVHMCRRAPSWSCEMLSLAISVSAAHPAMRTPTWSSVNEFGSRQSVEESRRMRSRRSASLSLRYGQLPNGLPQDYGHAVVVVLGRRTPRVFTAARLLGKRASMDDQRSHAG